MVEKVYCGFAKKEHKTNPHVKKRDTSHKIDY